MMRSGASGLTQDGLDMTPAEARRLFQKVKRIQGWFSAEAAYLFALLDAIQKENGIGGDIFEIGTHHGRSAVFLAGMLARPGESLRVCDIFGNQSENTSHSGSGNYEAFRTNMRSAFGECSFLRVFPMLSARLSQDLIGTSYRLFHIDGGHLASECLADLELAADCTVPRGVIVLDDAFRPDWPGVTEALFAFLTTHRDSFVPLVAGFNKLALVRPSSRDLYLRSLMTTCWAFIPQEPFALKNVELLGHELRVFHLPTYKSPTSLRSRLYSLLMRGSPLPALLGRHSRDR